MREFVFPLVAVVASLVSVSATAHAAPAPAQTWAATAAAPKGAAPAPPPAATGPSDQLRMGTPHAPPGAAAPPAQAGSPPPGGYPPPPYNPGYPAYPPAPYGYDPQRLMMYDHQKKEVVVSLVLEFLIPGLGSFYAGHPLGAAITWGLTLGGFVLAFIWIADVNDSFNDELDGTPHRDPNPALLFGAMGLILAGRVYGLYDAYASTKTYNGELAARLGLPPGFSLGITPIKSGHQLAWGPQLALRF